jgi:biopolymer transport protein ExbD
MAFASFDRQRSAAPVAEINMVPLIDVMLVLLVIFIVSTPLLTHSVPLQLPRASAQVPPPVRDKIDFAIDAQGQRYWNGQPISRAEAADRFRAAGAAPAGPAALPELHLRADRDTPYRPIAETLADAAAAGLSQVGFVSQPE